MVARWKQHVLSVKAWLGRPARFPQYPKFIKRRRIAVDHTGSLEEDFIGRLVSEPTQAAVWDEFHQRFDPFIGRLAHTVFRTCFNDCSDREPSDLSQELYLHLWADGGHALRHFRGRTETALRGYLARVCYNLAHNQRQHACPWKNTAGPTDAPPAVPPRQELAVLRCELHELIEKILHQITKGEHGRRDYLVFMLRYFGGRPAGQVASLLRIAPNLVDTIYHRVTKKVEMELAQALGGVAIELRGLQEFLATPFPPDTPSKKKIKKMGMFHKTSKVVNSFNR